MDKVYSQATSDACKASMRHILFLNKPIGATADNSVDYCCVEQHEAHPRCLVRWLVFLARKTCLNHNLLITDKSGTLTLIVR
jgi:hypothetical protein